MQFHQIKHSILHVKIHIKALRGITTRTRCSAQWHTTFYFYGHLTAFAYRYVSGDRWGSLDQPYAGVRWTTLESSYHGKKMNMNSCSFVQKTKSTTTCWHLLRHGRPFLSQGWSYKGGTPLRSHLNADLVLRLCDIHTLNVWIALFYAYGDN